MKSQGLFVLLTIALFASPATAQTSVAPDFALKDSSGTTVTLSSFRGHPVLLDFWATWCAPCQVSIPQVERFYLKHQGEGLIVLGLNMNEKTAAVPAFVERFKMTYPVLLAARTSTPGKFNVENLPTYLFIDPQGHIDKRWEGFSPELPAAWESEFQKWAAPHGSP